MHPPNHGRQRQSVLPTAPSKALLLVSLALLLLACSWCNVRFGRLLLLPGSDHDNSQELLFNQNYDQLRQPGVSSKGTGVLRVLGVLRSAGSSSSSVHEDFVGQYDGPEVQPVAVLETAAGQHTEDKGQQDGQGHAGVYLEPIDHILVNQEEAQQTQEADDLHTNAGNSRSSRSSSDGGQLTYAKGSRGTAGQAGSNQVHWRRGVARALLPLRTASGSSRVNHRKNSGRGIVGGDNNGGMVGLGTVLGSRLSPQELYDIYHGKPVPAAEDAAGITDPKHSAGTTAETKGVLRGDILHEFSHAAMNSGGDKNDTESVMHLQEALLQGVSGSAHSNISNRQLITTNSMNSNGSSTRSSSSSSNATAGTGRTDPRVRPPHAKQNPPAKGPPKDGLAGSFAWDTMHDSIMGKQYNSVPQSAYGGIPHVLHVNFMGGEGTLAALALQPRSHFRKEWRASCKGHHPGPCWHHMFWDEAAALRLLHQHYPWFLPTYHNYSTTVLRSDALRPFVLHTYGGVYLDLDTECFASMDGSLQGASLVLMAEEPGLANNAQMGSAAGHPIWPRVMARMLLQAQRGVKDPLYATGPRVITAALRELVGYPRGDLPGLFTAPIYPQASDGNVTQPQVLQQSHQLLPMRVYGPGQWFNPCSWNDESCHHALSRVAPLLRRPQQHARTAHVLACVRDTAAGRKPAQDRGQWMSTTSEAAPTDIPSHSMQHGDAAPSDTEPGRQHKAVPLAELIPELQVPGRHVLKPLPKKHIAGSTSSHAVSTGECAVTVHELACGKGDTPAMEPLANELQVTHLSAMVADEKKPLHQGSHIDNAPVYDSTTASNATAANGTVSANQSWSTDSLHQPGVNTTVGKAATTAAPGKGTEKAAVEAQDPCAGLKLSKQDVNALSSMDDVTASLLLSLAQRFAPSPGPGPSRAEVSGVRQGLGTSRSTGMCAGSGSGFTAGCNDSTSSSTGIGSRPGLVGAHHFSGSWLGYDGSKGQRARAQAADGVEVFFMSPLLFKETSQEASISDIGTAASATAAAGSMDSAGSAWVSPAAEVASNSTMTVPVAANSSAGSAALALLAVLEYLAGRSAQEGAEGSSHLSSACHVISLRQSTQHPHHSQHEPMAHGPSYGSSQARGSVQDARPEPVDLAAENLAAIVYGCVVDVLPSWTPPQPIQAISLIAEMYTATSPAAHGVGTADGNAAASNTTSATGLAMTSQGPDSSVGGASGRTMHGQHDAAVQHAMQNAAMLGMSGIALHADLAGDDGMHGEDAHAQPGHAAHDDVQDADVAVGAHDWHGDSTMDAQGEDNASQGMHVHDTNRAASASHNPQHDDLESSTPGSMPLAGVDLNLLAGLDHAVGGPVQMSAETMRLLLPSDMGTAAAMHAATATLWQRHTAYANELVQHPSVNTAREESAGHANQQVTRPGPPAAGARAHAAASASSRQQLLGGHKDEQRLEQALTHERSLPMGVVLSWCPNALQPVREESPLPPAATRKRARQQASSLEIAVQPTTPAQEEPDIDGLGVGDNLLQQKVIATCVKGNATTTRCEGLGAAVPATAPGQTHGSTGSGSHTKDMYEDPCVHMYAPCRLHPEVKLHEATALGLLDDPLTMPSPMHTLQTLLQRMGIVPPPPHPSPAYSTMDALLDPKQEADAPPHKQHDSGRSKATRSSSMDSKELGSSSQAKFGSSSQIKAPPSASIPRPGTILLIDAGTHGSLLPWDVLHHLYLQDSRLLSAVHGIVLQGVLLPLPAVHQYKVLSAYTHLYQELGFVGLGHHREERNASLHGPGCRVPSNSTNSDSGSAMPIASGHAAKTSRLLGNAAITDSRLRGLQGKHRRWQQQLLLRGDAGSGGQHTLNREGASAAPAAAAEGGMQVAPKEPACTATCPCTFTLSFVRM